MGLIDLPGGNFWMGSNDPGRYLNDGEGPVREVKISPFAISATAVSNSEFAAFVEDTGYVTTAEKENWSFVFAGDLPNDFSNTRGIVGAEWWRQVHGADWRHPEGQHSEITNRDNHPVVHVSWFDAAYYATWSKGRLPTEAEWEYAARGGLIQSALPWGNDLLLDGKHHCNIWTGTFPTNNTAEDGWVGTCPVDAFKPNDFGLFNCSGNVWEWCADWFTTQHTDGPVIADPIGPSFGTDRVVKGGSFLCHDSYCHRYRLAARSANTPESTSANQGFRIAH